ncbi:MAG: acetyl-CoA carboxylase biotin carboxyl carrier protein subunit [Melioribacteraceae bacterium]|nr:MAG: acetyl-CoA carboxylase biotin carboxyl carrier protein subunit [Melioribacteraceae bacterium]
MDINLLKKLIKVVETSDITDFSVQEGDLKVRISKRQANSAPVYTQPVVQEVASVQTTPAKQVEKDQESAKPAQEAPAANDKHYEVKSPIVGTFYRAPSPDADPYIQVGDKVSSGNVLCIVEAMKLMNEIESDVAGKVVKILVENGKPVEYNQPLFIIEKE